MNPIKIAKNIYWVGAVDWSLRNFHGYSVHRGSTYNAYLIIDEKITLIDTVKAQFADEMLSRISKIIDPSKIDYLISNHVEMDHSGSIPAVMEVAKNAKIITSVQGQKGLTMHYGTYDYHAVKDGDEISLGKHTLQFVPTPMLHWPDNMVTYCPEEKILFSNDAFGQHYSSTGRFDDDEDLNMVLLEAKLYYANILMPFDRQVKAAIKAIQPLDIELIAPSHGIMWRSHIKEILDLYTKWSSNEVEEKAVIIFDSMWQSTEKMAKSIEEAFGENGVKALYRNINYCHNSDIMGDLLTAKYIVVGSSTLNNNMMPPIASFLSYMKGLAPKGERKAFAFGSYGWSGQSIGLVEDQLRDAGFEIVLDKMRIQYIPSSENLSDIAQQISSLF